MSQSICKLCLFKSEPVDEIFIEESAHLRQIIRDLFHENVNLSKLELDIVCTLCREKLKSFHEYYKFVLENQQLYTDRITFIEPPSDKTNPEFIVVKKEELNEPPDDDEPLEPLEDDGSDYLDDADDDRYKRKSKRVRVQIPRSRVLALQQQQSDLIGLLFDFQCFKCALQPSFNSFRKIVNHYKNVHKLTKTWTCCGKEMTFIVELVEHVMEHKGKAWTCEKCTIDFNTAVDLWIHNNEKHGKIYTIERQNPIEWLKLRFTCDLCDEKFRALWLIRRHMKHVHIKKYKCFVCSMRFSDRKESARHQRTEHTSIPKLPCPYCGILIKNKHELMAAHISRSHTDRSLICPTCGKVYTNHGQYRSHLLTHKPPKHKCRFCEKRFKTSNHLKDHEATHTGIARYFCEICGAPFKSAGNYSAHKRKLHPLEYQQLKLENQAKKYKL